MFSSTCFLGVKVFLLIHFGFLTSLWTANWKSNIKYITRKNYSIERFYEVMAAFRPVFAIVPVGEEAVDQAFDLKARDFEDALQYFPVAHSMADCLLARNIKDYGFATMKVMTPSDFLACYF